MTYPFAAALLAVLWVGLAAAVWDGEAGFVVNAAAAFILALIAYLPVCACVGAVWRLAECVFPGRWPYRGR